MKKGLKALLSVLLIGVLLFSLSACSGGEEETVGTANTDIPSVITFNTVDINGNPYSSDDMQGAKVVLINLWEPWCGPCVGEMPELQKLYENYKDQGLLIIGAYSDEEDAQTVVDDNGITYPIVHCEGNLMSLQQDYVPASYVYDGDGNLLMNNPVEGAMEYDGWEELILQYL